MGIGFEWDARKASGNRRKHAVTFLEASTVFDNPQAAILDDPGHSQHEDRELIVGESDRGNLLIVSFVYRAGRIRIISARKVTAHERSDYESDWSQSGKFR